MKFTVVNDADEVFPLEMDADSVTVGALKAHLADFGLPPATKQMLIVDGKPLTPDTASLSNAGLTEDAVIMVLSADLLQGQQQAPSSGVTADSTPEQVASHAGQAALDIRQRLQRDTDGSFMQQLVDGDNEVMEAALDSDETKLVALLTRRIQGRVDEARAERRRVDQLATADPFDMEAQQQIAEEIRKHNVEENRENALEQLPEAFASVTMLYVDIFVNDVPVKAFVDSGAQTTIISAECAERCGIMRLIDQRYAGVAMGVGTAKILGKVHVAPVVIGNSHFPSSFTVLEDNKVEFLLGLDMLRRHQCAIDLKDNVLRIGDEIVPFLAEKDVPRGFGAERHDPPQDAQRSQAPSGHQAPSPASLAAADTVPISPAPASSPAPSSVSDQRETLVDKLVSLSNQPRETVRQVLEICQWNEELAASQLMF